MPKSGRAAYRAVQAELRALTQILRFKFCLLSQHHTLRDHVAEKLALEWSPTQIPGWLGREYDNDPTSIYQNVLFSFEKSRNLLVRQLSRYVLSCRDQSR